jgi:dTDP-4-dehydrorhamnose 3,5-epimerase
MTFKKDVIDGLWVISPELKEDERGFLTRTFCKDEYKKNNLVFDIVQANVTLTKQKGTIRGLHFQQDPHAEDKIVSCINGEVFDVAVDLRKGSSTFGKWVSHTLSGDNRKMFYIPKGFAHGFQTLTDNCELQYFMSEYYSPEYASGVRWDDPLIAIHWPIEIKKISTKDQNLPKL